MARQEYEGRKTLLAYELIGSPHHVARPLDSTATSMACWPSNTRQTRNLATKSRTPRIRGTRIGYRRLKAQAYSSPPSMTARRTGSAPISRPTPVLRGCRQQAQEDSPAAAAATTSWPRHQRLVRGRPRHVVLVGDFGDGTVARCDRHRHPLSNSLSHTRRPHRRRDLG